jgi:microcystin-dependent protein
MAAYVVTNGAYSTLASSLGSAATTMTIQAGHGARFPSISAGDFTFITLQDSSNNIEIVKATARSTDTFTIVRAQEGTTARAYASADIVELRYTAAVVATVDGTQTLTNKTLTAPSISSPTFTTAVPVSGGGTGNATATAYAVQCGGTTTTGAHQSVASVGTSGQVLTSNGAAALPTFQTLVAFASGMLMPYAGATAPTGWLLCYGQAISRTTYADLFTAISTAYGVGDGTTTFNVPDFRGRAAFGKDNMGGTAASRLTTAGSGVDGATLGTGGGSQLTQQHTHVATDAGHTHNATLASTKKSGGDTPDIYSAGENLSGNKTFTTASGTASVTNADYGTGTSQNVPPALVVTYIIKT